MDEKEEFEYTLKEIAQKLNLSTEKVRQILLMALKKLKTYNKDKLLELLNSLS